MQTQVSAENDWNCPEPHEPIKLAPLVAAIAKSTTAALPYTPSVYTGSGNDGRTRRPIIM